MKIVKQACTLDCPDACKFNIYVENDKIVKIEGEKEHPYTKGFICSKGRAHLDRIYHKDRIYQPMLKVNGQWKEISFEEAVDIMAERLSYYRDNYSPKSVINYEQYGNGSLLKSINNIFFNFYGGSSIPKGGPCWNAGMKATRYDFGRALSNSLEDLYNSKSIILWGKNPANTSIHTYQVLKKAKKLGIKIIVIDPLYTDTAKIADEFIQINPSSDGALAMAMAKIIIQNNWHDLDYIQKYTFGFEHYMAYLDRLDLDFLVSECNTNIETVEKITRIYCEKYSTILIGHGLQRYKNGGNTIRAINALAAITGQIGFSGGGVNYANSIYPPVLDTDPYNSYRYADNREFYVSHISDFIEAPEKYSVGDKDSTPIKAIVVTTSNLLNQLPNLNRLEEAFSKIEFKVCFDLFMTDTAEMCDLFIPTSTTLESEDLIFSSMCNPYLTYNECAVEPRHKLMDEYYFFMEVARKMNIENYPFVTKQEYLSKVIKPLDKYYKDIDLEFVKNNYVNMQQDVAWKDKKFETVTKKYEFYSLEALHDGVIPIPVYDARDNKDVSKKFRLLTMHHKNTISSAHFMDEEDICKIYINDKDAQDIKVQENDIVRVKSRNGEINARVIIDETMLSGIVNIYQGWWKKHGNPNYLIDSGISDFGGQVAYYDTFVEIEKVL